MPDIVERLLAGRPTKFAGVVAHEPMDFEAADEIRRLRALLRDRSAMNDELRAKLSKYESAHA